MDRIGRRIASAFGVTELQAAVHKLPATIY